MGNSQSKWLTLGSLSVLCLLIIMPSPGRAQSVPDAQQIINALQASPTRKTRNIMVRKKGSDADSPTVNVGQPASIDLTVQFDFNSSILSEESRPVLANLAQALKSPTLKQSQFLIEGHTDAAGSAEHNLKLSLDRANQVRRYLVDAGVAPQGVTTVGRGEADPANPANPLGAENRRVRIVKVE